MSGIFLKTYFSTPPPNWLPPFKKTKMFLTLPPLPIPSIFFPIWVSWSCSSSSHIRFNWFIIYKCESESESESDFDESDQYPESDKDSTSSDDCDDV